MMPTCEASTSSCLRIASLPSRRARTPTRSSRWSGCSRRAPRPPLSRTPRGSTRPGGTNATTAARSAGQRADSASSEALDSAAVTIPWIDSILGLGLSPGDLGLGHVVARSVVVFLYLLLLLRVAKRRFLAQRDPLDVLLFLLLASMISRAINGSAAFSPPLACGLVLVVLHRGLTRLAFRSPAIARLLKGVPIELLKDGQWIEPALTRHAMSRDDVEEDLRLSGGGARPPEVKRALFERTGRVRL